MRTVRNGSIPTTRPNPKSSSFSCLLVPVALVSTFRLLIPSFCTIAIGIHKPIYKRKIEPIGSVKRRRSKSFVSLPSIPSKRRSSSEPNKSSSLTPWLCNQVDSKRRTSFRPQSSSRQSVSVPIRSSSPRIPRSPMTISI